MKGFLVLEDGTVFAGEGFGAPAISAGEVVFNTDMTGYQRVLTDPSYAGQIVTMTYPLIGNYGILPDELESRAPWIRGFVVKELSDRPSHWKAIKSPSAYLEENRIPGVAGLDTRALTRHLRRVGTMRGVIATASDDTPVTSETTAAWAAMAAASGEHDLVDQVTVSEPCIVKGTGHRVVVVDYGVKSSTLHWLQSQSLDLTVVSAAFTAKQILALDPQGILLSSGPGNPGDLPEAVGTVEELLQAKDLPIFGIGLGFQIVSLALGGAVYKLPCGHRGSQPVKESQSGRVYITVQNHGYAVDESKLPLDTVVTHRNLNDNTLEGLMHKYKPVFGIQYHPAAPPALQDAQLLLERFIPLMDRRGPAQVSA